MSSLAFRSVLRQRNSGLFDKTHALPTSPKERCSSEQRTPRRAQSTSCLVSPRARRRIEHSRDLRSNPKLTLKAVLANEEISKLFRMHLEKECSVENYDFYTAIKSFKLKYSTSKFYPSKTRKIRLLRQMQRDAKRIFTKYVDTNGEFSINVGHQIRSNLEMYFEKIYVASLTNFAIAREETEDLSPTSLKNRSRRTLDMCKRAHVAHAEMSLSSQSLASQGNDNDIATMDISKASLGTMKEDTKNGSSRDLLRGDTTSDDAKDLTIEEKIDECLMVFDTAHREVMRLMERDSFRRFVKAHPEAWIAVHEPEFGRDRRIFKSNSIAVCMVPHPTPTEEEEKKEEKKRGSKFKRWLGRK